MSGSNLPKKSANEDVAGVAIKLAKDLFDVEVPRESIVSAKRSFNQKSIIIR